MAAASSMEKVPDVLANQTYVVHRSNAPKGTIQALKFGERKLDWICIVCSRGMKDEKAAGEHTNTDTHKTKVKDEEMGHLLLKLSLSDEQIVCMTEFLEPIFQRQSACHNGGIKIREQIAHELQALVRVEFPDVSAGLHGSSTSKFALQTSDVNINLSISEQNRIAIVMKRVAVILRREAKIYADVIEDYISYNKIPRIIFKHRHSKLAGEIRVNVGNPLSLAFLLHLYHSIDHRVHQLGVLFRYWAKVCRVASQVNGHYPAHMFIVMVIHYLQQRNPPVVPVLHEMFPELEQKDQPSSDSVFVTEEVVVRIMEGLAVWECQNSEPLGQLWLGLFRYYAVDFNVEKYAVSILRSTLLPRENTNWGTCRLAVEGTFVPASFFFFGQCEELFQCLGQREQRVLSTDPMIPRSNLARAASCDKVFWYLWSSIKQSAVHFNDFSLQLAQSDHVNVTETKDEATLSNDVILDPLRGNVEDNSVPSSDRENTVVPPCDRDEVVASLSGNGDVLLREESVPSSGKEKSVLLGDGVVLEDKTASTSVPNLESAQSSLKDISTVFESLSTRDSTNPESVSTYQSPVLTASAAPENSSKTVLKEKVEDTDVILSSVDERAQVCVTDSGQPQSIQEKAVSERKKRSEFKVATLTYKKYPVVCLGCKRLQHTIINCPSEKLPSWRFPKSNPSQASLKSIKKLFAKHLRDIVLNEQDEQLRQGICDTILSHVQSIYPDAELKLFGSSANGFSSYKSDLDVCLSLPQLSIETMNKAAQGEIIEAVAKKLKKFKGFYHDITTITTARVPIIKFYLPEYRLECDISLENRLALRNTKLIYAYASFDERVRYLGYAVKHFAKTCDMGDASTGSLSSYAYILMTIHYLQRTDPPVIPCLQQIPSDHPEGPLISNWNCYFYESDSDSLSRIWPHFRKNQESVGQLWLGFLKYYLTFDWVKEVVTIRQLQPLLKFDKWWVSKLMCIEDPFNLDHNLAASIGGKMRQYILERFYSALCYHSRDQIWKDIGYLFDTGVLVGAERVPKFFTCNYCNGRGHKAATCPRKKQDQKGQKTVASGNSGNDIPSVTGHPGLQQMVPAQLQGHPLLPAPAQRPPMVPTPAPQLQQGPPLLATSQQRPPLSPASPHWLPASSQQQWPSLSPASPQHPWQQQWPPLLPASHQQQGPPLLPASPQLQQGAPILHTSPQGHPSSAFSARMTAPPLQAQTANLSPSVAEMLQYHSAVQGLQPPVVSGSNPLQQIHYQQAAVVQSSSSSSSGLQAPNPSAQQRICVPGSSHSRTPYHQGYAGGHQQPGHQTHPAQYNRHHATSGDSHYSRAPGYQSLPPYVVESSSNQVPVQQPGFTPGGIYSQVPSQAPYPNYPSSALPLQHQTVQHIRATPPSAPSGSGQHQAAQHIPPGGSDVKHQARNRSRKRKY